MRRRWRPIPRQQLVEMVDRMGADAGDDVVQPGLRLEPVEGRRAD